MGGRRLVALALLTAALSPAIAVAAPRARSAKPPVDVHVVLPKAYARDHHRRWPVVYLLNTASAHCTTNCAGINAAIAKAPHITVIENQAAVLSDYVDWHDGSQHNEQRWLQLVRWVDAHYRTAHDRAHRAIGGISAGGYGAYVLSAHHPDLFAYAGSISGPLDIRGEADAHEAGFVLTGGPGPTTPPGAVWGTPVVDDDNWKRQNPLDQLPQLKTVDLFHSSGNGVPCEGPGEAEGVPIELIVHKTNDAFHRAAQAAGVRTTYVTTSCGVHSYAYFTPRVVEWLASLPFDPHSRSAQRH